ncbi:MAG: hypothetical protein KGZ82_06525 [Bacteroidales bacterium]|nr:hypothetical protein [Bacteroidales bacterium]
MVKKWIILVLAFVLASPVMAQYMKNAVGVRGGISRGISFQHFFEENKDLKLLMSFRDNGMQLTVMMSHYESVAGRFRDNFYFYYGMGLHGGYTRNVKMLWYFSSQNQGEPRPVTRAVVGADGLLGAEYRIFTVPLSFGIEYKPFFDLFGHRIFRLSFADLGFTFRYHF